MHMTKVREWIAKIAAILLIIAFVIGLLILAGKRVPYISDMIGQ